MTDAFRDRERNFENKWAHDEELRFKVTVRRDKLVGLWAAGEMGLSGSAAEDYAKSIIRADMDEPGDEDVFRKLRADFDAAKANVSDHMIRRRLDEFLALAGEQILSESGR
jgi:hypothetical protein